VPLLTITNRNRGSSQTITENQEKKPCVVLTARVHPGETVGSWMMRGAINFLTDA